MREITEDEVTEAMMAFSTAQFLGEAKPGEKRVSRVSIDLVKKHLKVYELDDVGDIIGNYEQLSRPTLLGEMNLDGIIEPSVSDFLAARISVSPHLQPEHTEYTLLKFPGSSLENEPANLNYSRIFQVFARDVKQIERVSFSACLFTIADTLGRTIDAVMVYREAPYQEPDEIRTDQLALLLSAGPTTPLDVSFAALPQDFTLYFNKGRIQRGMLLDVYDIHHSKGDKEEFPYARDSTPEMVSVSAKR